MSLYKVIHTQQYIHHKGKIHESVFFMLTQLQSELQLYIITLYLMSNIQLNSTRFYTCNDGIQYSGNIYDYSCVLSRTRIFI